jgi:hypothetical protein
MCVILLHGVTIVVGKKNYNKGREIVLTWGVSPGDIGAAYV